MSRLNRDIHKAAQRLRGLRHDVDRLMETREMEGRVTQVRNIHETISDSDDITVTDRDVTFLWHETSTWGFTHWDEET